MLIRDAYAATQDTSDDVKCMLANVIKPFLVAPVVEACLGQTTEVIQSWVDTIDPKRCIGVCNSEKKSFWTLIRGVSFVCLEWHCLTQGLHVYAECSAVDWKLLAPWYWPLTGKSDSGAIGCNLYSPYLD